MFRYLFILAVLLSFTACSAKKPDVIGTRTDGTHITKQDQADNYFKIGVNALSSGELPKAFESFFKALEFNNKDPKIYDLIAYAYIIRGDDDKADEFYNKALELNPATSVYNNYANFLISQKRYKEAIKYAQIAADDPTYEKSHIAYISLGDAYFELNMQKESMEAYKKAMRINNRDSKAIVQERIKRFKN